MGMLIRPKRDPQQNPLNVSVVLFPPVPQSHSPPIPQDLGSPCSSTVGSEGQTALQCLEICSIPPTTAVPPRGSHGACTVPICSKQTGCHGCFTEEENPNSRREGRSACYHFPGNEEGAPVPETHLPFRVNLPSLPAEQLPGTGLHRQKHMCFRVLAGWVWGCDHMQWVVGELHGAESS